MHIKCNSIPACLALNAIVSPACPCCSSTDLCGDLVCLYVFNCHSPSALQILSWAKTKLVTNGEVSAPTRNEEHCLYGLQLPSWACWESQVGPFGPACTEGKRYPGREKWTEILGAASCTAPLPLKFTTLSALPLVMYVRFVRTGAGFPTAAKLGPNEICDLEVCRVRPP